jgi:Tol biopolymer transport system component
MLFLAIKNTSVLLKMPIQFKSPKLVLTKFSFSLLPLMLASLPGTAAAATVVSGVAANTCLELPAGGDLPGTQLQLDTCNGSEWQQFTIGASGQIQFGSWCLDDETGMGANGDPIILWYCTGATNQNWSATSSGTITGVTGKCLNVTGSAPLSKVVLWACNGSANQKWTESSAAYPLGATVNPCTIEQFQPSPLGGLTVPSPGGAQYLVNKNDSNGVPQIYVGQTGSTTPICITCTNAVNGPTANRGKMQPHWTPSGQWIVLAVEQPTFTPPAGSTQQMIEGWLESGLWMDMWAVSPDGSAWYKLQGFEAPNTANGFTGVAFTPNGQYAVWAQIVNGNVLEYEFGQWQLILAEFQVLNGVPSFTNPKNITPANTDWVEPGNFSSNGTDLVLTADTGFPNHANVQGMDQFVLNVFTGQITNLTNSPAIWDEHGVFSADGEKIFFMSSYPYSSNPYASTVIFLKTEFMMMNKDGSGLQQISHFNVPGYPEYSVQGSVAANGEWSLDGTSISALNLMMPNYKSWQITFAGSCGGN